MHISTPLTRIDTSHDERVQTSRASRDLFRLCGALGAACLLGCALTLIPSALPSSDLTICLVILSALPYFAIRLIRADPSFVWSPIVWFLLVSAIYYGFGPLSYIWGTNESVAFMDSFYAVTDTSLFRTNLLNIVSLIIVSGVASVGLLAFRLPAFKTHFFDARSLRTTAILLILIGLPIKLFVVFPSNIGLFEWDAPGWARGAANFSTLALVPLSQLVAVKRSQSKAIWFLVALFAVEIGTAILTFSKLEVLRVLLVSVIAYFWVTRRVRHLLLLVGCVVLVYVVALSGFIAFLRGEYGATGSSSVIDILSGYETYSSSGRDELADVLPGVQGWWTRLSYANAQAFAMDAYDSGAPGDSFGLAVDALIPRFIYPDKPEITVGAQFNTLVTGFAGSKSAPGSWAEAYWNGGWAGAMAASAVMGLFFAFFTQYTRRAVSAGRYLYLGPAWLGMAGALQPDSWFVATYVGSIPTFVAFHMLISLFIEPSIGGRGQRKPS